MVKGTKPLGLCTVVTAAVVLVISALLAAALTTSKNGITTTQWFASYALRRPWQWSVNVKQSEENNLPTSADQRLYVICAYQNEKRIYTGIVNEEGEAEAHECLAVQDNRIAHAGTASALQAWCTASAEQGCSFYRLNAGQSIVPGLHDAHGHVLDLGWSRSAVDLVGATSRAEVVRRIEEYVNARPDLRDDRSRWIQGLGWDQTKWTPATFPLAEDLDSSALLRGRKIMLRRIDVHALWLSRAALDEMERAKVMPPAGKEIEGGLVMRNDKDGTPSGCLIDKAMDLAYRVIPPWSTEDRHKYLDAAAEKLLSVGITSVGDAAVDLASIAFYQARQKNGSLPLRIYAMLACPPDQVRCAHLAIQQGLPIQATPFTDDRLTVRTVKLFADGALGSWGSAMWEPYEDKPDWRGLMLIGEKDVYPLIRYWVLAGWNVATHCIGDRAQSITLDAYERILQKDKLTTIDEARFRIEHAQIVRKQDIPRFATSGVIASMQPTHCTSDMGYVETRIGAKRAREGAYAWSSMLAVNATLALGSDFPVELPDPVHGFYSAVTRLDEHQRSPQGSSGWYPEQRISRGEALRGFTAAPAFAQFEEHVGGTLTDGKRADFVILDDDLVRQQDLRKLRSIQVLATFIDGQLVWRRRRA